MKDWLLHLQINDEVARLTYGVDGRQTHERGKVVRLTMTRVHVKWPSTGYWVEYNRTGRRAGEEWRRGTSMIPRPSIEPITDAILPEIQAEERRRDNLDWLQRLALAVNRNPHRAEYDALNAAREAYECALKESTP